MELLMIGTSELLIIGGAILLLFGGKKIPELMRSMGQGVRSFKEGMKETVQDESQEISSGKTEGSVTEKNENEK